MNAATITQGNVLLINERLCAERVQPHVKRGDAFIIVREEATPSGLTTVVVHRPSDPTHTYRVNPQRFKFTVVTPTALQAAKRKVEEAVQREQEKVQLAQVKEKFARAVQHTQRALHTEFTPTEKAQIAIIPNILAHIAFFYAKQAHEYCARHRLSGDVKKVTRAITQLRQEYDSGLSKGLDLVYRRDLECRAREFLADPAMARHMTISDLTLENELFTQNKQVMDSLDKEKWHIELRRIATWGLIFIEAYKRQAQYANKIVRRRGVGYVSPSFDMEDLLITDRLNAQFIALQYPFQLRRNTNIRNIEAIIDKQVRAIEVAII